MKALLTLLFLAFIVNSGYGQTKPGKSKQQTLVPGPTKSAGVTSANSQSQKAHLSGPTKANSEVAFPAGDPSGNYTTRIISSEKGTFGYEILKEGRPMIRQTTIPGMPGNYGFAREADAKKVADAVIIKLRKGEMPPTVSEEELKELNVLK